MKIDKTILAYHLANFSVSLDFILPIWLIFFTVTVGFSATESMILGVGAYLISLLLEIPTGIIADKFGPKISYISGSLLFFVGMLFYLFPPSFWLYAASSVVTAIGIALMSGSLESLIFEYLNETHQTEKYASITSNKQSLFFIGRVIGSIAGAYVFLINPILPFILIGTNHLISGFFVSKIKIAHKAKLEILNKDILSKALTQIKLVLKENPLSGFLLFAIFSQTLLTDLYFYTYPVFLKDLNLNLEFLGYLFAIVSICSALGSQLFKRYFSTKYLWIILYLGVSSILISALIYINNPITFFVALIVQGLSSGFIWPCIYSFWQPKIEKHNRTTVLSIFSFCMTIFSSSSALISGIVLDKYGLTSLRLYVMIIILIITFGTSIWYFINHQKFLETSFQS